MAKFALYTIVTQSGGNRMLESSTYYLPTHYSDIPDMSMDGSIIVQSRTVLMTSLNYWCVSCISLGM